MSEADRSEWDRRYVEEGDLRPVVPSTFHHVEHFFPVVGSALDLACGRGQFAVWLALRGLEVWAVDVSAVAIERAGRLASTEGVASRCHFEVHDLDSGLPDMPPVDLLVCHRFRDPRLYGAMIDRLAPGGLLAIATLSEVGAEPGRFRSGPGELRSAFGTLEILDEGEGAGTAWLLARR